MTVTVVSDDDNEGDFVEDVQLPRLVKAEIVNEDPFNIKGEELKKLNGVNRKLKRALNSNVSTGYRGKDGTESKQIADESFYGYSYLECVTPPHNITYLAKLYSISPAHRAAVNAKVASVFGLGWDWIESPQAKLKRDSTRTQDGMKRLESHIAKLKIDMTQWLEDVNNIDTWEEIMTKVGIDYECTGNGYLEIGRTSSGQIGYIGHIPSKEVRIRRQRDGFVQMLGRDIVYFRNYGDTNPNPVTTDENPNEIIHFRKYDPDSNYYGVPDIISAKNNLAGNEFASRYNLEYFENKAVPRHAIIVKGGSLSPTSLQRLLEFFESGLRGKHHRTIYVPLTSKVGTEADIEFKQIENDKQDFSFGDYREANNEEIFMAHRIPSTRAGVFGKSISLAASRDADKVFKEGYSRPEQAIFEKKLKPLFREKTDVVEFKLNELSLVDADTQSKIDERDTRMGIVVPDEVRQRRGQPARPDGDGNKPWQANAAQQMADQKAAAMQNRTRDSERKAGASQGASDSGSRNAKGDGRKTP